MSFESTKAATQHLSRIDENLSTLVNDKLRLANKWASIGSLELEVAIGHFSGIEERVARLANEKLSLLIECEELRDKVSKYEIENNNLQLEAINFQNLNFNYKTLHEEKCLEYDNLEKFHETTLKTKEEMKQTYNNRIQELESRIRDLKNNLHRAVITIEDIVEEKRIAMERVSRQNESAEKSLLEFRKALEASSHSDSNVDDETYQEEE